VRYPAVGLVVSGGHTELILIKKIGEYEILAQTMDDALGKRWIRRRECWGWDIRGSNTEKMAREAHSTSSGQAYPLPLPMARSKDKNAFPIQG